MALRYTACAFVLLSAGLLAACGGGGGAVPSSPSGPGIGGSRATPAPTPTPTPTPTPGALDINPSSLTMCPSTGSQQCNTNSGSVTLSQSNYSGIITESDDCANNVAVVTAVTTGASNAQFTVKGQSAIGTCRATFTGGDGKQTGVAIIVTGPGVGIDLQPRDR